MDIRNPNLYPRIVLRCHHNNQSRSNWSGLFMEVRRNKMGWYIKDGEIKEIFTKLNF